MSEMKNEKKKYDQLLKYYIDLCEVYKRFGWQWNQDMEMCKKLIAICDVSIATINKQNHIIDDLQQACDKQRAIITAICEGLKDGKEVTIDGTEAT